MLIADFHGDLVLAMHQLDEQAKKESHALLHQLAYMLRGWSVVAYAIRGDPRTEVIRKAQESQVNVILVGSRGRGFLQRTMLGSFSDYLVHHAPCPVLVVRPNSSSSSAPTTLNKDTQHEGTEGFTQKASEKEDQKEKKL
ncbi:hypothetical protein HMI54_014006 [Coelomomyces lativittatus]|nr:hypothetical protein HMI54_014006 [Coelomomyces lativittatus]